MLNRRVVDDLLQLVAGVAPVRRVGSALVFRTNHLAE
jgi:hypothetical protein